MARLEGNVCRVRYDDRSFISGNIITAQVAQGERGSKGFGTITFSSAQEAQYSITEFNGADLDGRTIEVRFDRRKTTSSPPKKVCLKKSENDMIFDRLNFCLILGFCSTSGNCS